MIAEYKLAQCCTCLQDFANTHVKQQKTQSCFASNCAMLTLCINMHGFFTISLSQLPLKSVTQKASGMALLKAILKPFFASSGPGKVSTEKVSHKLSYFVNTKNQGYFWGKKKGSLFFCFFRTW